MSVAAGGSCYASTSTPGLCGLLTSLLPFEISERLQEFFSLIITFGAEVFFVAVLLGYAWSRTRQQFMRL